MSRPKRTRLLAAALAGVLVLACGAALAQPRKAAPPAPKAEQFDYGIFLKQLKFRNIGPANMGGRTVDFAVPDADTSIIYAAVGPSGLWKSVDSGITWLPSFHKEGTVSVGAVAVSQSHPDIVWVGTGEATARNSVAPGDGVYKSEDGGRTWKKMGLEKTLFVSRIAIDPADPDKVYVAAQGHLWGPNEDRGVYRTTDGGKTWTKTLYVNPTTGAADLAMDPSNSRILYAAMWDYLRLPYIFRSGGEGSGLYRTTDGGETWKKLTEGLPPGVTGRIGVGVSRSNPAVVYALIENKSGGLFRSDDKGETWKPACDKRTYDRVNFRPFYYSRLTVDPTNELVLYVYSGSCFVSKDGGKSFENVFQGAHPDHHAVWVDPRNSRHVISGNDGGIDISWDGGRSIYGVASRAWAEVYNVAFDMRDPYYVYVGLQDNGNWGGPSNSRDPSGILNHMWYPAGGGDGFYTQIDPEDWSVVYRNLQMGGIERHNIKTGESVRIRPEAKLGEPPFRFNWNSPITISPHDHNVLYFGGNFLFKSTDRGNSWVKASPDLTTNDPAKMKDSGGPITVDNTGAENHCTILTVSESPLKKGVLWVGTDDGLVQVTRDGGANWENVTKNIKGLGPDNNWVTRIEASHFVEGGAYLTVSRHQVDDYKPYIFKTEDFGKTWVSLRGDLPEYGYLHVVREDPENRSLLFAGSEFGLFASFDGGRKWLAVNGEFPTVAVRDIQIHPRERDLVIGTHGRGVWIVDDIRFLEKLTAEAVKSNFLLFDVKPAVLFSFRSTTDMYGDPGFAGPNSPFGAALGYYLNPAVAKDAKIRLSIVDQDGREVNAPAAAREAGFNRVNWPLRESMGPAAAGQEMMMRGMGGGGGGGGRRGFFGGAFGPWALPGEYKAVLEVNGEKAEKSFSVKNDPDSGITLEDRKLNQKCFREAAELSRAGAVLLRSTDQLSKQLQDVEGAVKAMKSPDKALLDRIAVVREKLDGIAKVFFMSTPEQTMYRKPLFTAYRGGTAAELVLGMAGTVSRTMGMPTQTTIDQLQDLKAFVAPLVDKMKEITEKDVPDLNRMLAEKGVPYIKL
jgi:photosystem II stability/assembly factor-like uncharacterized protein